MIISSQNLLSCLNGIQLMRLFWLKEEEIENPKSVLLPSSPTQNPYFFASLLFLITANDFPNAEEQDKDEVSKAKKDAVRQFVNGRITQMSKKREELQKVLSSFDNLDVELNAKLIDNLTETEESIVAATAESKDLLSTLLGFKEKETETKLTYSHFQSLKSQYMADIERLAFIVDGEKHVHSLDKNKKCPFCDGSFQPKERKSYIEASKAELNRTIIQLQGLSESENDVISILNDIQEKIRNLEGRKAEIETLIESELTSCK